MRFTEHPIPEIFGGAPAYGAYAGKYSFIVVDQGDGWHLSWQDQEKGGSASSTGEGPFKTRDRAEARCRKIYQELLRKQ